MMFQKWNPPPYSISEEEGSRGKSGGRSQGLKLRQVKVPDGTGRWRREGERWEDDLIGWGRQGLEEKSRATGMAGLYGRANLTLWVVGGSRDKF